MKKLLSFVGALFSPLFSIILLVCSSAPFMTFITVRMKEQGFNDATVSYVHSAFYAGYLLGSARVERLIRRIGFIRSFAVFGALYCASVTIQGLYFSTVLWILCRFVGGFCVSALYIIISSWLLVQSTPQTRGKILSLYMIAIYASQSFSQLFLNIINPLSLAEFLFAALLGSISIIPVAFTYYQTPEPQRPGPRKKIAEMYKEAPLAFIGSLTAGLILSSIYSFVPNYAHFVKISVPLIMMITLAGGFVLQWPIGLISDKLDRRKILIITSFTVLIPAILIIFLSSHTEAIYILSFILGGLTFTIYPLSITHMCDKIEPIYITYATSILSLTYGVGSVIGPLISGQVMEYISPSALYLYIAGVAGILAILGIYYKIKRPISTPSLEKSEYIPLAGGAPSSELDPRTQEEGEKEEDQE